MSIEVTARNPQIHEKVQQYARDKGDTLCLAFPKIEGVHVILEYERHAYRAQMVVRAKGAQVIGAGEHPENCTTAIDDASDKVERQLRKMRDKVVEASRGT